MAMTSEFSRRPRAKWSAAQVLSDGEDAAGQVLAVPCRSAAVAEAIQEWILHWAAGALEVSRDALDPAVPLSRHSIESPKAAELMGALTKWLDVEASPTLLWETPSISALAEYLAALSSYYRLVELEGIVPTTRPQ